MQAKQRAIFQAITGRPHSGRTIQTIRMALLLANTPDEADIPLEVPNRDDQVYETFKPRTVVVVSPDTSQVRGCISMWKEQGNKIRFCELGDHDYLGGINPVHAPTDAVIAVIADELNLNPLVMGKLTGLLEKLDQIGVDTIIGLPALAGLKGDLKMTSESRGLLNHCPVGTEIFLTEMLNKDGTFEDRCKIRRVGQTMPFKI